VLLKQVEQGRGGESDNEGFRSAKKHGLALAQAHSASPTDLYRRASGYFSEKLSRRVRGKEYAGGKGREETISLHFTSQQSISNAVSRSELCIFHRGRTDTFFGTVTAVLRPTSS